MAVARERTGTPEAVTDRWVASAADRERIAALCHALGFQPNQVTAMSFESHRTGIAVSVTRVRGA